LDDLVSHRVVRNLRYNPIFGISLSLMLVRTGDRLNHCEHPIRCPSGGDWKMWSLFYEIHYGRGERDYHIHGFQ